jgi:hypothetical protein
VDERAKIRTALILIKRIAKKIVDSILSDKDESAPNVPENPERRSSSVHPWRLCPAGQHWRRPHLRHIESKKISVTGHCVTSPGGKEWFHGEEFQEIAQRYFSGLEKKFQPKGDTLGYPDGNKFDISIGGWTRFWNEVLRPDTPLDPNWVKALMATESGFENVPPTKSKQGPARGVLQVTENTRKILADKKGEVKDHYIEVSAEELENPDINIATALRWLHHKKHLLEKKLKRPVTWEEAIHDYKGIRNQIGKHARSNKIDQELNRFYEKLKNE